MKRPKAGLIGRGIAASLGIKLGAAAIMGQTPDAAFAHAGHPQKALLVDRWYQRYEDSYSYETWITLTMHRTVPSQFAADWNTPITDSIPTHNDSSQPGGTHTAYFQETAPQGLNDVRVVVTNATYQDFGINFDTLGYLGATYLLDEGYHYCVNGGDCDSQHSRPNTWWYVVTLLDNDAHSGPYGTAWQRQATVAHELGHAIGLNEEPDEGQCSQSTPKSVMDYDC